ncbi:MAG: class I SAM-dependent methyltransferase [Candidatus Bathyarchaeia archaeon]
MKILDVGCGFKFGHVKRGTIGVDLHRGLADVIADAHHLPFKDESFDGCYAYAILEHVDNPYKVLSEINRVLRSRKWVKILVPTDSRLRSDYVALFFSLHWKHCWQEYKAMKSGEHKWQYSENGLRKILDKTGFEVKKVERPSHPFISGRRVGKVLKKLGIVRHPHLIVEAIKR